MILSMRRLQFNALKFLFSTEADPKKKEYVPKPVFSSSSVFKKQKEAQQNQNIKQQSDQQSKTGIPKPQSLEAQIQKINKVNQHFLGIKLNTNYLKTFKQVTVESLKNVSQTKRSANDFPLRISTVPQKQSVDDTQELKHAQKLMSRKATQIIFKHGRFEVAEEKMQQLIKLFTQNFVNDKRLNGLEPNFEAECIKTRNSLTNQQYSFKLINPTALPDIRLTNTTVFFGLSSLRNNNYSSDSYHIDESELPQFGIARYQLVKQKKQRYPQVEWFSTLRCMGRLQALFRGGPAIQVYKGNEKIGSTSGLTHRIVFDMDLLPPPLNSSNHLTRQEYMMSYRFDVKSMLISNIDNKNRFYNLTYSEQIKRDTLISQIIDS